MLRWLTPISRIVKATCLHRSNVTAIVVIEFSKNKHYFELFKIVKCAFNEKKNPTTTFYFHKLLIELNSAVREVLGLTI